MGNLPFSKVLHPGVAAQLLHELRAYRHLSTARHMDLQLRTNSKK
jgi:hypothetical protein